MSKGIYSSILTSKITIFKKNDTVCYCREFCWHRAREKERGASVALFSPAVAVYSL